MLWLRFLWFYLSTALILRTPPFLNWSKWVISIFFCQFELIHPVKKTYIFETVYNFFKLIMRNIGVRTKISLILHINCTEFESASFCKIGENGWFQFLLSIWFNPSCQEDLYLCNGVPFFQIDKSKQSCYA